MPLNCGTGEDSWKSLGQQGYQTVNLKGDEHWIFTARTDAEAEAPVFWSPDANRWLIGKVPDLGKDWGQKEKSSSQDETAGRHHRCSEYELGQTLRDGEGQEGLACYCPWGRKESDMTRRLNSNKNNGLLNPLGHKLGWETILQGGWDRRHSFPPSPKHVPPQWKGRHWKDCPRLILRGVKSHMIRPRFYFSPS